MIIVFNTRKVKDIILFLYKFVSQQYVYSFTNIPIKQKNQFCIHS